jgi:hypothetical protein
MWRHADVLHARPGTVREDIKGSRVLRHSEERRDLSAVGQCHGKRFWVVHRIQVMSLRP